VALRCVTVTDTNSVSAGWGSDLRITAVAAMTPFLAGMLVLLGYAWIGGFGVVLGLAAAIWWAVWWYRRNDGFFPRDVNSTAFGVTIGLTVVAFVLVLIAT
jgi:hypothetical protein